MICMTRVTSSHFHKGLEEIWHQVPPDYYQNGVSRNMLQRMWHSGKVKAVLDLIDIKPKNILDIGCASGWFLSQIAKHYTDAICSGIDVYKKAIDHGAKQYKHLRLIYGDAHALPFNNNSFDLVVCAEVLEHVLKPEQVLDEIKRVLRKDGTAIIEMDTGNYLFKLAWYWWTHVRHGVWKDSHIHAFNTKKLEQMIKKKGFLITKKMIFNNTMAVAFRLKVLDYNEQE